MARGRNHINQSHVFEDGGATCLARVLGNDGAAITQASVSTITCAVYDLDSAAPSVAIISPTVTVGSAVFDTLQGANNADGRWSVDLIGYNFLFALPATSFPTGGHKYTAEFKVTPASGAVFWLKYEFEAIKVLTS